VRPLPKPGDFSAAIYQIVMAGLSRSKNGVASARLCPAIHGSLAVLSKTWMPATSSAKTRFALLRGHDVDIGELRVRSGGRDEAPAASAAAYRFFSFGGGFFGGGGRLGGCAGRFGNPP
jgi:hypothetical protein